jgi:hypothetical protein
MPTDTELELYRTHRSTQDRYCYFMLAAAGAAIAFAVTRSQDMALSYSQIPLAFAVVSWGVSFFAGSMNQRYVLSTLYANMGLLKVQSGAEPGIGTHPQMIKAASQGVRSALETNSNRANRFSKWQFYFLIIGAIFFVGWDVYEMYLRTTS